ncbi:MAG: hypothetical protein FWB80_03455 [Defluviitaleaceae bacterium]|nr:hypothetical protein [Defluviitaleaceae bacterium]
MKSILEKFANENIDHGLNFTEKKLNYESTIKTIRDCEEKLLSMLEGEQKELMIKYSEARFEANAILDVETFIHGYRLGVLMTMEVFMDKKNSV